MAKGIDVHPKYQRNLRWSEVDPNHIKYVWVKVSDGGAAYVGTEGSARFYPSTMVNGAKSRGIPVGGYHYAQPSPSPEAQADILIQEIERLGATSVWPALDLEAPFVPDAFARQFGERFCNRVRARGYPVVAYMNDSFAKVLKPDEWDANPVLWIARYGAKPVWTRYDVHQYSQSGTIAGATVDMNESYNNAHLNTGGDDVALDASDKTAIRDIVMDALTGSTGMWYGPRFKGTLNYAQVLHQTAADAAAAVAGQANLVKLLTDRNDATAEDIAEALLPNVVAAVQAELADVEGADEVAIAQAVTDRIGGLLRPGTGATE